MSWQKWTLCITYVLSAAIMVSEIGKPRKPRTIKDGVFTVLLAAVLVTLVVTA